MYDTLGLNRLLHWIQISVKSLIKSTNQGSSSKNILGKDTYLLLLIQLWHNKKNPRISKVFQLYKVVVIVLLLPGHQNPPDLYGIWDSFVLPDLEKRMRKIYKYLCIYIFFNSSKNSLLDKAPNNNLSSWVRYPKKITYYQGLPCVSVLLQILWHQKWQLRSRDKWRCRQ